MYLDWDAGGIWCAIPEEWLAQGYTVIDDDETNDNVGESSIGAAELVQDRMERFVFPGNDEEYEAIFEDGKWLYFDDLTNSWQAIPLALEYHVPSVNKALRLVENHAPQGSSIAEILLALRQNRYDPKVTVDWYENERSFAMGNSETAANMTVGQQLGCDIGKTGQRKERKIVRT